MASPSVTTVPQEFASAEGDVPATDLDALRRAKAEWRERAVKPSEARMPPRKKRFSTWSDVEVPDVLTPADVPLDYMKDLGLPGEFPFTRGVQPTMYRARLW